MQTNSSSDSKSSRKPAVKARPKKASKSKADGSETLHLNAQSTAGSPNVDGLTTSLPDETRHKGAYLAGMVAEAAYYIAQSRSFAPGHELEDWLQAEQQIRTRHS